MPKVLDFTRPAARRHREGFCLMWYACACGHQERIWNSRDGVTPFIAQCPSCGAYSMQHERQAEDKFEPDHRPRPGQRVWIDMTRDRAEAIVDAAIAARRGPIDNDRRTSLIAATFRDGHAPDLIVWQWERAVAA